jgi:hypothetical protein
MTREAGNRGALADIVTALILALQETTFPSDEVIDEASKMLGPTEAVTSNQPAATPKINNDRNQNVSRKTGVNCPS